MQHYVGRSDADLGRAEDLAYTLASSHGGTKQFHVVEVGREGEEKGRIYVTDNEGLDTLENEVRNGYRLDWINQITTKGYEEDE